MNAWESYAGWAMLNRQHAVEGAAYLAEHTLKLLPILCRNEYLSMGILHVTQAVSFLNNDAKMVSLLATR